MEKIKKFLQSFIGKGILFLSVLLLAFGIRIVLESKQEEKKDDQNERFQYAEPVREDNQILKAFQQEFPEMDVILACEEDLTDDGKKDLVVIYRDEKHIRMRVAVDEGKGTYRYTEPLPGPVENQTVQFKNIDEEGPIEFIISGEKNGNVGYAIYRMIDGEPADLFGDGMEDCC
ncbi:MAG: hypothetical protein KHZ72_00115 [Lachnospiraceae bacterium]|nr:hypothetical protein [Lachnospiraceae bacterium]